MNKYQKISAALALVAIIGVQAGFAAKKVTAKKPVNATVAKVTSLKTKYLTVVAGTPFTGVPAAGSNKIVIKTCPADINSALFSVKFGKELPNVRLSVNSDFTGPGKIDKSCFNVSKVVDGCFENSVDANNIVGADTDITTAPQEFWLDANVPSRTKPGTYTGAITVYYKDAAWDVIPIEIVVSKLVLITSSKQCAIFTDYTLDKNEIAEQSYVDFLSGVKRAGFRIGTISATPESVINAINDYGKSGLVGPVPLTTYSFSTTIPELSEAVAIDRIKRTSKINNMLYFCKDIPTTEEDISLALQQLSVFKNARLRSAIRTDGIADISELMPYLEDVCYSADSPYVQNLIKGKEKRTSSKWEWLWWDASESVEKNRLYAGIGTWKSGLDGCMPVIMGDKAGKLNQSVLMASVREGIDDTRYLTIFMKYLREVKDLKRAKDADYIETVETYVNNFLEKPLNTITQNDLDTFRSKLQEYTTALIGRTAN